MSARKVGRAAAWGMILISAVLSTLVVLTAMAHQFSSVWLLTGVMLLVLAPWGTVISALVIRERTGSRLP